MVDIIENADQVGDSDIIGDLVPTLYLKRVILQGGGDVHVKDDPHIREDYVEIIRRSDGHLGEDLRIVETEVDLNTTTGNPNTSENLKIDLDLCVKDKLTNNIFSSWFLNDDDINKYLKSIVILVKDQPAITKLFNNIGKNKEYVKRALIEHLLGLGIPRGDVEYARILDQVRSFMHRSDVYETFSFQDTNILQREQVGRDTDGNYLYDINLKTSFTAQGLNPASLSVVTFSYVDVAAIAVEYNFDASSISADMLSGEIKVYNLIVDGAVSDNSTVFYDRQGKVWPGPVHFHPTNGWMAGARHTNEPHSILTKRIVPNMLVQDFRNVAEVEKNQVDLRAIENLFPSVNKLFSKFVKDNLDVASKKTFTSDVLLSRGVGGECKFFFSVDFRKLCKENTKFSKLIDHNPSLLNNFFIKKIKVIRRRKLDSNLTATSARHPPRDFLSMPVEEPVVYFHRSESLNRNLPSITPAILASDSGRNNSLVEVADLQLNNDDGVKHFTGVDRTISTVTFGKFEYGVELEVYDPTEKYIGDILNRLLVVIKSLEAYLRIALIPVSKSNPNTGNYDYLSNRFTSQFSSKVDTDDLRDSVTMLTNTLAVLGVVSTSQRLRFMQEIYKVIEPNNGSPRGIETVLAMARNILNKMEEATLVSASDEGSTTTGATPPDRSSGGATAVKHVFKHKVFFENDLFDTEVADNTGFEALGVDFESRTTAGLDSVAAEEYDARCTIETLKYFTSEEADVTNLQAIPGDTMYSDGDSSLSSTRLTYLSPIQLLLKSTDTLSLQSQLEVISERRRRELGGPLQGVTIGDPEELNDVSDLAHKASQIFRYNTPGAGARRIPGQRSRAQGRTRLSEKQLDTRDNLTDILALNNVTIEVSTEVSAAENLRARDENSRDQIRGSVRRSSAPRLNQQSDSDNMSDGFVFPGDGYDNDAPTETSNSSRNEYTRIVDDLNENLIDIHTSRDGDALIANNLFLNLLYNLIVDDEFSSPEDFRKKSNQNNQQKMSFYNLGSNTNGVKTTQSVLSSLTRGRRGRLGQITTTLVDIFNSMPNQIKALFASSVRPDIVRVNYHSGEFDPFKDPQDSLGLLINYFNLYRIEVLVGFNQATYESETINPSSLGAVPGNLSSTQTVTERHIKNFRFVPLTDQIYEDARQNNFRLLCRMRPYVNQSLGIKPPKGLDLGMLDQHFFIGDRRPLRGRAFSERDVQRIRESLLKFQQRFRDGQVIIEEPDAVGPIARPLDLSPRPPAEFNYNIDEISTELAVVEDEAPPSLTPPTAPISRGPARSETLGGVVTTQAPVTTPALGGPPAPRYTPPPNMSMTPTPVVETTTTLPTPTPQTPISADPPRQKTPLSVPIPTREKQSPAVNILKQYEEVQFEVKPESIRLAEEHFMDQEKLKVENIVDTSPNKSELPKKAKNGKRTSSKSRRSRTQGSPTATTTNVTTRRSSGQRGTPGSNTNVGY